MSSSTPVAHAPDGGGRIQEATSAIDGALELPAINTDEATAHNATYSPTSPTAPDPKSTTSSDAPISAPGNQTSNAQSTGSAPKKGPVKLLRKDANSKDVKDARSSNPTSNRAASPATPIASPIDPLSQHILTRTNTDRSIAAKFRPATGQPPESPANDGLPQPVSETPTKQTPAVVVDTGKEKKKGFLSRLSMIGNSKKKDDDDDDDDNSSVSELRTEGANAIAFASSIGAGGYIPQHKEPPRYIKVRAHDKKQREFDRMFLAQELLGTRPLPLEDETSGNANENKPARKGPPKSGGPVWAMEFSRDGSFLATGGRDRVVRVWAVFATPEERDKDAEAEGGDDDEERGSANSKARLSAPVFQSKPVFEFSGHTGDILDLSWSKNNFLLSSSMDKTVRLWHMSRQECLCTFKHKDFVTSIAFHPRDDRFFLAGSLDSTLRLWSIPDKAVAYSAPVSDLITAVAFSPDGKTSLSGSFNGVCSFFETEGLRFQSQIHVRSSRGKNAKGSKITGIETKDLAPATPEGDVKVLVTSNDSRIRIYNLKDKQLESKLKDHENTCNQIRASFSDDGKYIICGSEDRKTFIWSTDMSAIDNKDKRPCEFFEAHSTTVTQAIFTPTTSRVLLQASHDPIFALCNPPPVTLLSKEESTISLGDGAASDVVPKVKRPEETPAYISRSRHEDGNILVTAGHDGMIKVFRQDCAFLKRKHESWETGSTFSKKMGKDGFVGRTGSIVTRTSASSIRDPHSRRGSISRPPSILFGTPQVNSDRINTWRHGIEGNASRPASISMATPARSERSMSPSKARSPMLTPSAANLASEARKQPYAQASPQTQPLSPTSSVTTTDVAKKENAGNEKSQPPTPSFSFRSMEDEGDELRLDPVGASYSFWNLNRWRNIGGAIRGGSSSGPASGTLQKEKPASSSLLKPDDVDKDRRKSVGSHPPPPVKDARTSIEEEGSSTGQQAALSATKASRRKSIPPSGLQALAEDSTHLGVQGPGGGLGSRGSVVSRLSSELTSSISGEDEGEELRCEKCEGREFKAKKVNGRQMLLCTRCGRMAEP